MKLQLSFVILIWYWIKYWIMLCLLSMRYHRNSLSIIKSGGGCQQINKVNISLLATLQHGCFIATKSQKKLQRWYNLPVQPPLCKYFNSIIQPVYILKLAMSTKFNNAKKTRNDLKYISYDYVWIQWQNTCDLLYLIRTSADRKNTARKEVNLSRTLRIKIHDNNNIYNFY